MTRTTVRQITEAESLLADIPFSHATAPPEGPPPGTALAHLHQAMGHLTAGCDGDDPRDWDTFWAISALVNHPRIKPQPGETPRDWNQRVKRLVNR